MGYNQTDGTGPAISLETIHRWALVNPRSLEHCNIGTSTRADFMCFVCDIIDLLYDQERMRKKIREQLLGNLTYLDVDDAVRFFIANELPRLPMARGYKRAGKRIVQEVTI